MGYTWETLVDGLALIHLGNIGGGIVSGDLSPVCPGLLRARQALYGCAITLPPRFSVFASID